MSSASFVASPARLERAEIAAILRLLGRTPRAAGCS
jgi:hypothetical protein